MPHHVPKEHEDHLRQTIDSPIDPAVAGELIDFEVPRGHTHVPDESTIADPLKQ